MNNSIVKPVIILGSGGHAKIVAEALLKLGHEIIGFAVSGKSPRTTFCGFTVLGDDDVFLKYLPDGIMMVNGVGAMPHQRQRWQLASRMSERGYSFLTTIHPSTVIAGDVELAEGVQVMAGAVIQPGARVGRDSIINTGVLLDHDCTISANCHLASGVVLSGGVNVGEGAHIGTGTSVIQNISIGINAIVAAGSVIYKNVPDGVTLIQKRYSGFES